MRPSTSLETDWNDLLERSELECAWLTHQWLDAWWRAFGAEALMFVPTVWRENRMIAAAPMMVVEAKAMRQKCRVLRFMENGITPRSQFLVAPEAADGLDLLWSLIESSRKEWDLAILANVPHQGPLLDAWRTTLTGSRLQFIEIPDRQSPFIDLSEGFQTFLKSISSKQRENIKASRSRLSKRGTIDVRTCNGTDELLDALEICFAISGRSWKAATGSDLASRSAHQAFYRALAEDPSFRDRLHVKILTLDDRPVAFNAVVQSGQTVTGLATDYDLELRQASPGVYLLSRLLEDLSEIGISRCDMAGQMYEYKLSWTKSFLPHSQFWLFHKGMKSRRLRLMKALVLRVRDTESQSAVTPDGQAQVPTG